MANQKTRISSIDFAKGIAALLMVLTHTLYFFSGSNNEILFAITRFTDLTTFSLFFFLSGTGIYLSYLAPEISQVEFNAKKEKLLHRAFKLLLAYYLLAFISDFPNLLSSYNDLLIRLIKIVFFIQVPQYVEFIISFIAFYLVVYFFRRTLKHISNSFFWVVFIGISFYLFGYFLHFVQVPSELIFLKALIVGESNWYRFPLLQYSIVYLLGTYWGKIISYNDLYLQKKLKFVFTFSLTFLSAGLIFITLLSNQNFDLTRWPPSVLFLTLGITYTPLLVMFIEKILKIFNPNTKTISFLSFISNNLSDYFILHLVVLFIIQYIFHPKFTDIPSLLIIFAIVFIIVTILVLIGNSHKLLGPLREGLSLRSFDALFIKLFYIFIACWLIIIFGLKVISKIDTNTQALIEETITNANYIKNIENNFNLEIKLDRKTAYKITSNDSSFDKYKSIIMDITVQNRGFDYKGIDIYVDQKKTTTLQQNNINIYNWPISADSYETGNHEVYALIVGTNKESPIVKFNISYPLFVAWTIDWEGYDISDANIKALNDISAKYSVPMVQLVTPRVFMANDVSAQRKEVLKNWVLTRYSMGDEIGMHLHMHYDLFTGCNLPYKTAPKWDDRLNGHDVLTSAYSSEEFSKLVECALAKFKEYKFPTPVTYRAGGWFIDLKNLKVLATEGFIIDTSGRDKYTWGRATGFWDLPSTTKPFLISDNNQNIADNTNNFGLIEAPNNGMDSTNQTAETLISKFNDNYPNKTGILPEMQVLTYMSHPHWITAIDKPQLIKLFDYISKYSADNDNGPVIFTTLNRVFDYAKVND